MALPSVERLTGLRLVQGNSVALEDARDLLGDPEARVGDATGEQDGPAEIIQAQRFGVVGARSLGLFTSAIGKMAGYQGSRKKRRKGDQILRIGDGQPVKRGRR